MKFGRVMLLVVLCLLVGVFPAFAQNAPLVALVNSGGQLIVSSGDGGFRWIVTNPGETLVGEHVWSPRGDQLFFAVSTGGAISLRAANVAQQSVTEIGQAAGGILTLSPDGSFVFTQQNNGSYAIQSPSGEAFALPVTNDAGARYSGLWADSAPLVAYWGYAGNSQLAVTDAASTQTALLDSGRSSPVLPLAWLSGTAQLVYRDVDGLIRLADFSCVPNGCGGSPADVNVQTLASADAEVATDSDRLYFRSGSRIAAVDFACASADTCLNSAVTLAESAAPQTSISAAGGVLVYTGYAQNPNDPNDREVRAVNLACLNSGGCTAQALAGAAVAGTLSANGRYVVIESANGLESLDLSSGARAYLSERGAALAQARWQP